MYVDEIVRTLPSVECHWKRILCRSVVAANFLCAREFPPPPSEATHHHQGRPMRFSVHAAATHPVNEDEASRGPIFGSVSFHSAPRKMKGVKTGGTARICKALSRQ
ncbi:hypothetical protein DAPPUDRAFT_259154 [Daphnia pulex]|uniref:Uncharacterized protein n=1 Tax=Daphnia pulex TaxID=6669 RepID=E9HGN7_DAPPU|nr:hypothetical protein DAPPUDRAFT_259154 [Daphnia pulex]|eukprot:EFX69120.1 hypothetical protein DAPPUDRAFT_259154 [Daphnia pulex]